jgi:hypothetical protein
MLRSSLALDAQSRFWNRFEARGRDVDTAGLADSVFAAA